MTEVLQTSVELRRNRDFPYKGIFGYHEPALGRLHNAKDKLVRPRHVIRTIREHSTPRLKSEYSKGCEASKRFAELTITRNEAMHFYSRYYKR